MDTIIHENREEKFEDTKGATRSRISKNRQHNGKKISKGQSEAVFRRTDNTMAKRKSTKGQITINKAYI